MKRILSFLSPSVLAFASDQPRSGNTHPATFEGWLIRAFFAILVIICGLLWAVKNKFTDYP
jgi:hypothetical protein